MDDSAVHIFWDQSNIYLSALDACERRSPKDEKKRIGFEVGNRSNARVHFQNLYEFARAERNVERAVAVGSIPPGLNTLWTSLKKAGVKVELQERGTETGKEQAVDETLQLHMLRSVLDRADPPAVAVVLTGDGDFHEDIQRMLDAGWGVEILCFGCSFSRKLRNMAKESHGRAKYVDLSDWYRQLVYLQGLDEGIMRPAEPLDLAGRPKI